MSPYKVRFTKYLSIFLDYCNNKLWPNSNPVIVEEKNNVYILHYNKTYNEEMIFGVDLGSSEMYENDNMAIMNLKHENKFIKKLAEEKLRNDNTIIVIN